MKTTDLLEEPLGRGEDGFRKRLCLGRDREWNREGWLKSDW